MEQITSRTNESVKRACTLRDSAQARRETGCFLAEGVRLCLDLAHSLPVKEVYYTEKALAANPHLSQLDGAHAEIHESVADKLADTRTTQGVFCVFEKRESVLTDVKAGQRWLILEHVQSPDNLGALLRSTAAFGFCGVVLCNACADVWSPKALRASMGGVGKLQIVICEDVQTAKQVFAQMEIPVVAAALQNSIPLDDMILQPQQGVALLIGNEGNGLTQQAIAQADYAVRIPMAENVESLNAAVAGSILLWHFRGM